MPESAGQVFVRVICIAFAWLAAALLAPGTASAQDPGRPDSLIIGNLDGSPIIVAPGRQAVVPVWVKTDDSVGSMLVPVATSDEYVSSRDGGRFYWPLTDWKYRFFLTPAEDMPEEGMTSQSIFGCMCWPGLPPLHTEYEWWHIADFWMTTTSDGEAMWDTTCVIEGYDPFNGSLIFGLVDGITDFVPHTVYGCLYFGATICAYNPGDVNGNGQVNVVDVTALVNWLIEGQEPACGCNCPPLGDPFYACADVNGMCNVNVVDITYLVNYLTGSIEELQFCERCVP